MEECQGMFTRMSTGNVLVEFTSFPAFFYVNNIGPKIRSDTLHFLLWIAHFLTTLLTNIEVFF